MFHAIGGVIEKYLGIPRDDVGGVMAIIGVIVLLYLWWRESRSKNKKKEGFTLYSLPACVIGIALLIMVANRIYEQFIKWKNF